MMNILKNKSQKFVLSLFYILFVALLCYIVFPISAFANREYKAISGEGHLFYSGSSTSFKLNSDQSSELFGPLVSSSGFTIDPGQNATILLDSGTLRTTDGIVYPEITYNFTSSSWQFSNDGSIFADLGSGSGGGGGDLQTSYDLSDPPQIVLTSTQAGIEILDQASTVTDLLEVKDSTDTITHAGLGSYGVRSQAYLLSESTPSSSTSFGHQITASSTTNLLEHTDDRLLTNAIGKQYKGRINFSQFGDADFAIDSDYTTGNGTDFSTGTLQGTFEISTTANDLIDGDRVFKYTMVSTSTNDWVKIASVEIPNGYRGHEVGFQFRYKYDGNDDDIEFKVRCSSSGDILDQNNPDLLKAFSNANNTAQVFKSQRFIPEDCTSIDYGFSVNSESDGSVLLWDELESTPNDLVLGKVNDYQYLKFTAGNGHGSTNTTIRRFDTSSSSSFGGNVFEATDSSTDGHTFTALRNGWFTITYTDNRQSATTDFLIGLSLNSSDLTTGIGAIARQDQLAVARNSDSTQKILSVAWSGYLRTGDVVRAHTDGNATDGASADYGTVLSIHAYGQSDTFITSQYPDDSTLHVINNDAIASGTNIKQFATTIINEGSALEIVETSTDYYMDIKYDGVYNFTATLDADPAPGSIAITKNSRGSNDPNGSGADESNVVPFSFTDKSKLIAFATTGSLANQLSGATTGMVILKKGDRIRLQGSGPAGTGFAVAMFRGTFVGFKSLSAQFVQRVAVIKDVKTSGTSGGTATSGSYQTRDLNTVEGDSEIVSLSSNQFTLPAGKYHIHASAPGYQIDGHKALIYNVTDASNEIIGSNAFALSGTAMTSRSVIDGVITLLSTKTFELRHRPGTTKATDGFGPTNTFGESEVYSIVTIRKLR